MVFVIDKAKLLCQGSLHFNQKKELQKIATRKGCRVFESTALLQVRTCLLSLLLPFSQFWAVIMGEKNGHQVIDVDLKNRLPSAFSA